MPLRSARIVVGLLLISEALSAQIIRRPSVPTMRASRTLGRIEATKIDGIVRIISLEKTTKLLLPSSVKSEIPAGASVEVLRGHLELKADGYTFRSDRGARFVVEDIGGYPVARLLDGSKAIECLDPNGEKIGSRPTVPTRPADTAPESIPADSEPEPPIISSIPMSPVQENRINSQVVVSPSAP